MIHGNEPSKRVALECGSILYALGEDRVLELTIPREGWVLPKIDQWPLILDLIKITNQTFCHPDNQSRPEIAGDHMIMRIKVPADELSFDQFVHDMKCYIDFLRDEGLGVRPLNVFIGM